MVKIFRVEIKLLLLIFCLVLFLAQTVNAEPEPAFSQALPYQTLKDKIETLSVWAKGEYAEHEHEGLFKNHPRDGHVIKATIKLIDELTQRAAQAEMNGDDEKAQALLLSAEATARYAAHMPHLLEARLSTKNN